MPSEAMEQQAALRRKFQERKRLMLLERGGAAAAPRPQLARMSRSLDDDLPSSPRVRTPPRAASPPPATGRVQPLSPARPASSGRIGASEQRLVKPQPPLSEAVHSAASSPPAATAAPLTPLINADKPTGDVFSTPQKNPPKIDQPVTTPHSPELDEVHSSRPLGEQAVIHESSSCTPDNRLVAQNVMLGAADTGFRSVAAAQPHAGNTAATRSAASSAGAAAEAVASVAETVATAAVSTASSAASAAISTAAAAASAAGCPTARRSTRIERVDMLREVTLFSGITNERMLEFADMCSTRLVNAGECVITQNEVGDEMYVVETGRLQATLVLPDGTPLGVVAEYRRSDYFGELALLLNATRAATIVATEASQLLVLRRDDVSETLQNSGLYHTLSQVPMFTGLNYAKLHKIGTSLIKRDYAAGDVVIKQGDSGDEMFVIESGRLEASVITKDGKDIGVVKTYAGGEFFGELALMEDAPRAATISAIDESTLFILREECVADVLKDEVVMPSSAAGRRNTYKLSEVIAYEEDRKQFWCGAPGIVIAPDFWFCRIKDAIMTALILFSCFWEPYKAAFAKDDVQTTTFEQVVNAIYWTDIALSFVTGYELLTHTELELKNIAWKYLTGWFLVDLVATFNWEWLFESLSSEEEQGTGGQLAMVRLLRLIRLLRILKMTRIVERLSAALNVRSAFIKIFNLLLFVVLVVHLIACFFYLVPSLTKLDHEAEQHRDSAWALLYANRTIDDCYGGPAPAQTSAVMQTMGVIEGPMYNSWVCDMGISPDSESTDRFRYLTSVYFSITTISTIGYGDISPNTNSEMELLFTTITEFVGMFIFSYVVSNIATLFSNLNRSQKEFQGRLDHYVEYMRDKNTPEALTKRVVSYLNYREASKFALKEEDEGLLCQLSPGLRMEMHQSYYREHLRKVLKGTMKIDESTEPSRDVAWKGRFIDELALCVDPVIAMPHDLIVHRGEPGSDSFFIIMEGTVQVYGNSLSRRQTIDHESLYPLFGVAEMFADKGTLAGLSHRSVRAKGPSPVDLARISKSAFDTATMYIPEARVAFKSYGEAELHGLLNLDLAVPKKDLQGAFDRIVAKYSQGTEEPKKRRRGGTAGLVGRHDDWRLASKEDLAKRRLTAAQLSELASDLGVELIEPNLSHAVSFRINSMHLTQNYSVAVRILGPCCFTAIYDATDSAGVSMHLDGTHGSRSYFGHFDDAVMGWRGNRREVGCVHR
jgi:CRP-like cAMP-binding protein